ncbi:MAG: hypothetical protein KGJ66_02630 [Alphaproteobacteria bacterium]|nr:hypothetical protein [Alphaproteobacteria bacterium]
MAGYVQLRVIRVALAAALCGVPSSVALANDAPPPRHGAVIAFIVGLRQSVTDSSARVLDEAAHWLGQLELGVGSIGELRPGISALALATPDHAMIPVARVVPLGVQNDDTEANVAVRRPVRLGLQELADATVVSGDRNWSIGHAQVNLGAEIGDTALDPETYLTGNLTRGPAVGAALSEHLLGGHDIELGLPLPDLPSMHITAARYWWGDRTFMQVVDGYRLGLSYAINPHLQFEGGRSEDQVHGIAGFFGFHYSIPLDTKRPPGVMPLNN